MGQLTMLPLEQFGLLSVEDAAKRKGVHPETVRSWLHKGLPVVSVGNGRNRTIHLVPIKALDAFQPEPQGRPKKEKPARVKKRRKAA